MSVWELVSPLLSTEAKLCVYYLEEVWDENFQQAFERLRESFITVSREHSVELARQTYLGEVNLFARLHKEAEQQVLEALRGGGWVHPPRVVFATAFSLVLALLENMSAEDKSATVVQHDVLYRVLLEDMSAKDKPAFSVWTMDKVLGANASLGWKVLILEYAAEFLPAYDTEGWLAEIKMLLFVQDLLMSPPALPPPPLRWLPLPLPRVPKSAYLEHVQSVLEQEVQGAQTGFLQEFSDKVGVQFANLRTAIPVVLALAEEYYNRCEACYKQHALRQVNNPNDETLRRYARQLHLRLREGLSWGQIADRLGMKREAVRYSTERALEILGIKLPKSV